MKADNKLFNYMLSIGFIVFIVLILGSLIFISRYILSDENALGDYVTSTQNLLEDINDVDVPSEKVDTFTNLEQKNVDRFKFNSFENSIDDFSILNMNENKGIISFVFDSKIEQNGNIYYIVLKDNETLEEGFDIMYFTELGNINYGRIFSIDENKYKIFNSESKEVTEISRDKILGKILFKDGSKS